jgi:hypothetical protein
MVFKKLIITFTPDECEALDRLAEVEVRPVKDQVRVLVRSEAEKRGLWPNPQVQPVPQCEGDTGMITNTKSTIGSSGHERITGSGQLSCQPRSTTAPAGRQTWQPILTPDGKVIAVIKDGELTKTISDMARQVGTGKAVSDDDPVTVVWVQGRGDVPITVTLGGGENSPTWRRVLPVVAARVMILVTVIVVLFGSPQQGQNLGHFLGGVARGLTGAP